MKGQGTFKKKVIILGFDGLSPEILEPMLKEGKLPNFARLKEEGSYSHLSTTNPAQSPVAWTGFSTGKNPGKNGVYDFIVRDPGTYGLSLSLTKIEKGKAQTPVKCKTFWQYASERNAPVVIISCPVTFPPDRVNGVLLSGMGVPDILGTEGTFTFYTSEGTSTRQDTGGKVFGVRKSEIIVMNLIGPKVASASGKAENVTVPFKAVMQLDKKSLLVEFQGKKCQLVAGQWSPWQEVTFDLGFLRKAKGIFKFYLVEIEPELKLYISPINFDPRKPFFEISYPASYSKELAEVIGPYHTQGMPMDTWAVNEKRLTEKPFLELAEEVLKEKTRMLDYELGRFKSGVLFCYFENSDIIQHMFWRYRDPQHPLYEKNAPPEYKQMIEAWYKKMDDILGDVLRRIDREDTLIVLSDHGFTTFRRAAHINSWLRKEGYLELKNPYAQEGSELLLDIDWPKTKAYAIGFGAVYLNRKGREKGGIVEPEDAGTLKEEIAKKLEKWMDGKYNQAVINKVYKQEEIFSGDFAKDTPDLYIGFNKGYRASWQTALGAVPKDLMEDNLKKWSGDHLIDPGIVPGIIFANRKITKENPSIYDLAPTVLKVIGFDEGEIKEKDFDGSPLY